MVSESTHIHSQRKTTTVWNSSAHCSVKCKRILFQKHLFVSFQDSIFALVGDFKWFARELWMCLWQLLLTNMTTIEFSDKQCQIKSSLCRLLHFFSFYLFSASFEEGCFSVFFIFCFINAFMTGYYYSVYVNHIQQLVYLNVVTWFCFYFFIKTTVSWVNKQKTKF